ncbi:MAG: hypothetical protein M3362_14425, partial [Acidobacteriota bacterium]|nr:hypothetical protein [Acidobacteriota bacterium]
CRFDLRAAHAAEPNDIANDSINYQSTLIQATEDRWIEVGGGPAVYALLYFPVLRQLMKLLATARGSGLLAGLCREIGISPFTSAVPAGRTDIECLRVSERHRLKGLAAYILDDWPRRFMRICATGRVWSSTLLRDFEAAPFWYWNIVHEHLYRKSYCASDEEVASIIAHINNSGGIAYQKTVSGLVGVQNVFRKRKTFTDFSHAVIGRARVKVPRVK